MNYSKLLILGSLFICKSAISIEPQKLLLQFKAMAEEARARMLECYKVSQEEQKLINPYYSHYKEWQNRTRLDHLKIYYTESDGTSKQVYIQLERSIFIVFFGLVSFNSYNFDQKEVANLLIDLCKKLPLDKKPKFSARISRKLRLEKRLLIFNGLFDDLYSVTLDYREENL